MIRQLRPRSRMLLIGLWAIALLCVGPLSSISAAQATASALDEVTITVNEKAVSIKEPLLIEDGKLFISASRIAGLLKAKYSWNKSTEEATIHSAYGDTIIVGNEVPVVYFNEARYLLGSAPFLHKGSLYVPLRDLTEMLHAELYWNGDTNTVELALVPAAIVTEENTLAVISKETGITQAKLLARNGLDTKADVKENTKLRIVMPAILSNKAKAFTNEDLELLANISQIEAGRTTYEGQLGVANVILNRVKDSRFPNTIEGVVYSGKQFPPAHNGTLDKSTPNASALRAAKDALNGKNNVKNALYFFNPKVTKGAFWSNLDVIVTIDNHSFAR
jgi:N-acetylmuramoyl-L-alanine amidase